MRQMVRAVFGAPSGVTPSRSAAAAWPEDRPADVPAGFAAGGGTGVRHAFAGKMPE